MSKSAAFMVMFDELPKELRDLFNEFDQDAVVDAIALVGRDAGAVRRVLERDRRKRQEAILGAA